MKSIDLTIITPLLLNNYLSDWQNYSASWKDDAKGIHLRVLAGLVDQNNEEMIEMIPEKARAGYVAGC